jgi:hypothetical protein
MTDYNFSDQTITSMKTLASIATLAALAFSAFADGTVSFQNGGLTRVYLYDYATLTTNPVTSATLGSQDPVGGYGSSGVLDVGLVWGTSASSVGTIYGGTLAGIATISSMYPGEFSGNALYGAAAFPVPGTNPDDVDYFQVYAWDSAFGNSLAGMQACVASGGYFGAASAGFGNTIYGAIGAPLQINLGNAPPAAGPPLFGTGGNQFRKFIVLSSPEPATIAIGGLGAAALLMFRRRK